MKSAVCLCVILHVCPPHHITNELSGTHVSNFHAFPRLPVQSQAVQARVQLFHLFTQEAIMFNGLYTQNHATYFMRRRLVRQLRCGRGVNYSATLHFVMRNVRYAKKLRSREYGVCGSIYVQSLLGDCVNSDTR